MQEEVKSDEESDNEEPQETVPNNPTNTVNNNKTLDHTFDYSLDSTWEQQKQQFASLVASSVLKMFYKHNNTILNSTPEQLQLHTQLTNREGERMFSLARRFHDNRSLETRAVVIKSAIQDKQVLETYPNFLIDLAKENPGRYLTHQSNARKILDKYPTRAQIDSAKFRLSGRAREKASKNEN